MTQIVIIVKMTLRMVYVLPTNVTVQMVPQHLQDLVINTTPFNVLLVIMTGKKLEQMLTIMKNVWTKNVFVITALQQLAIPMPPFVMMLVPIFALNVMTFTTLRVMMLVFSTKLTAPTVSLKMKALLSTTKAMNVNLVTHFIMK